MAKLCNAWTVVERSLSKKNGYKFVLKCPETDLDKIASDTLLIASAFANLKLLSDDSANTTVLELNFPDVAESYKFLRTLQDWQGLEPPTEAE